MFATVCYVIVVLTFFAALGRSAIPRAERIPWVRWSLRDLLANVVAGARLLVDLHERDPLTPQRRTPFHG